jgi:ABC-type phosphate/phosphonate transport system substrate-binding protein/outer membrane protein assembly factor BamB
VIVISRHGIGLSALRAAATIFTLISVFSATQVKAAAEHTSTQAEPLRIVVMDPLCDRLACDCVKGYAQRKYDKLSIYLEKKLGRKLLVAYGENLPDILKGSAARVDVIIGKQGIVLYDAAKAKIPIHPIARLTDKAGSTDLTGLFVVRKNDPAKSIDQLKDYRIIFGPEYVSEKSTAALDALKAASVPAPSKIRRTPACTNAALAVVEKDADAAIISSYALALLEGCDTIDKGALRTVGQTSGIPFVTVFATSNLKPRTEKALVDALVAVKDDEPLLKQMESKSGFVRIAPQAQSAMGWTDWRGPRRDGISPYVPTTLPTEPRFLWRKPLTGIALSGIAANDKYVIVADKGKTKKTDIFRCLDAETGDQIWTIEYPASTEMDFTDSPRANPVIHDGFVYLLGALGDLHCAVLETGRIEWKKNVVKELNAELVAWGMCATPLIVDDKVIVNPGAEDASILALNHRTGELIWKTPGQSAAYSAFIVGVFGGVRQIVGYDSISVGGWDVVTGKRLWTLLPKEEGDFNVPTPIRIDGKLLLTTENNGTRLYDFDEDGRIRRTPIARNSDLAPDTSTPVVINGRVFGCFGGLYCLDLEDNLNTLYHSDDPAFEDYAALVAGNDRVLIITVESELILIDANADNFHPKARLQLFKKNEIWSHPALLPGRIYIRNSSEISCLLWD